MKNCVFAGSFDPITKGHVAIVKKCLNMFDKVFVVVGENSRKRTFFTAIERKEILKESLIGLDRVVISAFSEHGDYGKYLSDNSVCAYVRGIRDAKDFKYEQKFEKVNKKLYPEIVTVYISADEDLKKVSSSKFRKGLKSGKVDYSIIPDGAVQTIKEILSKK